MIDENAPKERTVIFCMFLKTLEAPFPGLIVTCLLLYLNLVTGRGQSVQILKKCICVGFGFCLNFRYPSRGSLSEDHSEYHSRSSSSRSEHGNQRRHKRQENRSRSRERSRDRDKGHIDSDNETNHRHSSLRKKHRHLHDKKKSHDIDQRLHDMSPDLSRVV